MILRTDLAPTVWRGADGLTVQVRGYSDVQPRAGVTLRLLAENNDILGETTTDADGVGRFAAPLMHGEGPVAPRAIEVTGRGRLHDARPERRRVRPVRSRRGRAAASGTARCLCLARSRHLSAWRDGTGDGAAARRCRPAGRHPGACHRQAPERPGLPGSDPGARGGGIGASAGGSCRPARRSAPGRSR